jgi:hypothetical protein
VPGGPGRRPFFLTMNPQKTFRRAPHDSPRNADGTTARPAGSARAMRRTDHMRHGFTQPETGSQRTAVIVACEVAAQRRLFHGTGHGRSRNPDRRGRRVALRNPGNGHVLPVDVIHPEHDAAPAWMAMAIATARIGSG